MPWSDSNKTFTIISPFVSILKLDAYQLELNYFSSKWPNLYGFIKNSFLCKNNSSSCDKPYNIWKYEMSNGEDNN